MVSGLSLVSGSSGAVPTFRFKPAEGGIESEEPKTNNNKPETVKKFLLRGIVFTFIR